MIKLRDAATHDARAIAALLTELGYPASAAEIVARLRSVSGALSSVLVPEERFYLGLGFESRRRKFVRPIAG